VLMLALATGCFFDNGLSQTRSVKFGERAGNRVESLNGLGTWKQMCEAELARRPGAFAGYDVKQALAGCVHENQVLNQ
jgi:hypothetical protein